MAARHRVVRSAALLATAAYAVLLIVASPPTPDGDALGFLKKAADPAAVSAGHLLFVPWLRALGALAGARAPVDFWFLGRVAGALAIAASGLVVAGAARRLARNAGDDERSASARGLAAQALFFACAGVFTAGTCLESYGVTILAVALAAALALRARESDDLALAGSAIAAGLASGLHLGVAPVMALPVLAPLAARPLARAAALARAGLAAALAAAVFLGPIALFAAHHALSPRQALAFLGEADHGLPGFDGWIACLTAPFGAARALVASPLPWENARLFWIRMWPAAIALLAFAWVLARGARRAGRGGALLLVGGALPLAIVGVSYYASDPERWIVTLPSVIPVAALGARPKWIGIAAAIALAAHLATVAIPAALDRSDRDAARAMSEGLAPQELVVSPGHGPDELVGFFEGVEPDRFLMTYEGASRGLSGPELLTVMAEKIKSARRAGRAVRVLRVFDPADEGEIRGWKELDRYFQIDRGILRGRLESLGFAASAEHPRYARLSGR